MLFICSTPFQIVNMINLATTTLKNEAIDVYILDHSPECYKSYCILKESSIFQNVHYLKTKEIYSFKNNNKLMYLLNTFKKGYNAFNYKILEKKIPNKSTNYDRIFIAFPDLPSQIIYYYFKKRNSDLTLNLFEDGTSTYNFFKEKYSIVRKITSNIIFGSSIIEHYNKVFVYKPSYLDIGKYKLEVDKIPEIIKSNTDLVGLFNELMGFEKKDLVIFDKKYIFFDQKLTFDNLLKKQSDLLEIIGSNVGFDNMVVKIHPRTNGEVYSNHKNVSSLRLPFEIIELNSDISNKTLISIFSTVCLTPKIIFNEEPNIILLYKLINQSNYKSDFYNLALEVKDSYINPNRFFIPETVEELKVILKSLEKNHTELKVE